MSCSAVNCTNRSTQGFRLFRFPADPKRRKIWVINSKRDKWTPTDSARLCNVSIQVKNIIFKCCTIVFSIHYKIS